MFAVHFSHTGEYETYFISQKITGKNPIDPLYASTEQD